MYYFLLNLIILSIVIILVTFIFSLLINTKNIEEKIKITVMGCIGLIFMFLVIVFSFEPSDSKKDSNNPWDYINTI